MGKGVVVVIREVFVMHVKTGSKIAISRSKTVRTKFRESCQFVKYRGIRTTFNSVTVCS